MGGVVCRHQPGVLRPEDIDAPTTQAPGDGPVDVLHDGRDFWEVARPRVRTRNTHGTGCTYSAAIATELAKGKDVLRAVEAARDALQVALERALPLGRGFGPVNHGAMFRRAPFDHNDTTSAQ